MPAITSLVRMERRRCFFSVTEFIASENAPHFRGALGVKAAALSFDDCFKTTGPARSCDFKPKFCPKMTSRRHRQFASGWLVKPRSRYPVASFRGELQLLPNLPET